MLFTDTKPGNRLIKGGLVFLFLLFMASPCLAMGSRPPKRSPTILEGRIIDRQANQAISGASVKLYSPTGQLAASVASDTYGGYFISGDYTGTHIIYISAKGYQTASLSYLMARSKTQRLDFILDPIGLQNSVKIISVAPEESSTFIVGDTIAISIEAQNSGKGQLEYRYLLDDKALQDWTFSSAFDLQPRASDIGRHKIIVEAKNNEGGSDSRAVNVRIFRAFPNPEK